MSQDLNTVLITGGAGYVGSMLVPELLAEGKKVIVYDILYYGGSFLPKNNPNLTVIQGDIRDAAAFKAACKGVDAVIHLACISNDASFVLDESLSTTVNLDAFEPMVIAAKAVGVKRFIYASTSSVYGISEEPEVKEDHPLVPITLYNDFKGRCEPQLFKYMDDTFTCVTIRPATVCGYAPRLRLDLSVNILTNHAVTNGKILVFGGEQLRPNLNVKDVCRLYRRLLELPSADIQGETFNCGYQNLAIAEIANIVKTVVEEEFPDREPIAVETTPTDDIRSYHINSDKIKDKLNFTPEHTIEDAVRSLCHAFKRGDIPDSMDDDWYYNVRTMQKIGAH